MKLIDIYILSLGLGVDASTVGVADGINYPKMKFNKVLLIAFMFGLFQCVMPLFGYLLGSIFVEFISKIIPYLALIMLVSLGIKMILDSNKKIADNISLSLKLLIIQAIATSIDALTIGLLFVSMGFNKVLLYCFIIGIITFLMCMVFIYIAKKIGSIFCDKAYLIGGLVLIFIGVKQFIDYLV